MTREREREGKQASKQARKQHSISSLATCLSHLLIWPECSISVAAEFDQGEGNQGSFLLGGNWEMVLKMLSTAHMATLLAG